MKKILSTALALLLVAGCMTMQPKDLGTILIEGAGPVKMISFSHGEDGRQIFAMQTVTQRGQPINKGMYVEISSESEKKILKQIDVLEKAVIAGEFKETFSGADPLVLQIQIPDKKKPRQIVIRTNIGADPRVNQLMKWLNEEIPEGYVLREK